MNRSLVFLPAAMLLCACETLPRDAFLLSETALATREMQTREYDGVADATVLSASTAVLQDMGYAIDEIETRLGIVSASKQADASNAATVAGTVAMDAMQCVMTFMLGCTGRYYGEADDVQDIRLTLVAQPHRDADDRMSVRVTIQRIIWDKRGRLSRQETIDEPEVYQAFFDKLSKAVFLETEGL